MSGTRFKMRKPTKGALPRKLCEVLSCDELATYWEDDGRGYDAEYCRQHAEELYASHMEQYREAYPDLTVE